MKVIILCGGKGTRLSEETALVPKPMVQIGDRPILWHIMSHYAHHGHKDFFLALGYKSSIIKEYFLHYSTLNSNFRVNLANGDLNFFNSVKVDWNVNLIDTGLETMTAGRIKKLQEYIGDDENFLLTYGDGVSNVDIKASIKYHLKHGKIATMTTVGPPSRFGQLVTDETGKITKFDEKPLQAEGKINGGFFVLNKKVFDYLDGDDIMDIMFERRPLEKLSQDGELMSFKHQGFWQCMDTLRDKNYLCDLYETGDAPWVHPN